MKDKKIGVIVALYKEAENLIKKIENMVVETWANKKIIKGKIGDNNIILLISGIGKVNAAMSTQFLIDKYEIDFILNYGTCGGMMNSILGEIYRVEGGIQFDFDLSELYNVPAGKLQEFEEQIIRADNKIQLPYEKRIIGTSDHFTNSKDEIIFLKKIGCDIRDMEGGAILHVCKMNSMDVVMLKIVTDVSTSDDMHKDFNENLENMSIKLNEEIVKLLKN